MVHQVPFVGLRPCSLLRMLCSQPSLALLWCFALSMLLPCLACRLPDEMTRPGGISATSPPPVAPVSPNYPDPHVAERPQTDFQQATWPVPQNTAPGQSPQGQYPPTQTAQSSWPADDVGVSAGPPVNNPLLQNNSDVYDPTITVATVGDQYVLRGDLIGEANIMLAPSVEKIPPAELEAQRTQILAARDQMAKQLIGQAVERKLMYLEFLRGIPEDKRAEVEVNIRERVGQAFNDDLEKMIEKVGKAEPDDYAEIAREDVNLFRLALLMKQQKLVTTIQLDNYLRRYGSSLDKQRQSFAERALGRQALMGGIETQPEVTHIEMLEFYNKRLEEFQVPDRAKWEQLTARFDHFNSKEECRAAISAMGNEVWLGGAPLAAVAKRSSHGPQAKNGGLHDWTEWGDLEVSNEIQEVAFSIPPNELSPIIEDAEGFHIVRVIERSEAHITPFTEAQAAIKRKLKGEKRNAEIAEFVKQLRQQTPIWTIYDDDQEKQDDPALVADPRRAPYSNSPR